jgi:hypothetical protein
MSILETDAVHGALDPQLHDVSKLLVLLLTKIVPQ